MDPLTGPGMRIRVPDDILARAEANETDVRIALAVQFYADNRIDHSDACRLSGLSPSTLNHELLRRGITVQQYPPIGINRREAS